MGPCVKIAGGSYTSSLGRESLEQLRSSVTAKRKKACTLLVAWLQELCPLVYSFPRGILFGDPPGLAQPCSASIEEE